MRFRFCGGLEPPDWLLASLPLLSRLPEPSLLRLSDALAADVDADAEPLAAALAADLTDDPSDLADARAAVTALRFVLRGAARSDERERELRAELEQLGAALAAAARLAAAYERRRPELRAQLRDRRPSFARVRQVAWEVQRREVGPVVELALRLDRPATRMEASPADAADVEAFRVQADKFLALEQDLRHALAAMRSVRLA